MSGRYHVRERVIFDVVDSESGEVLTTAVERNTADGVVERLDAGQIRHTEASVEFFDRVPDDDGKPREPRAPEDEPARDVGGSNVT